VVRWHTAVPARAIEYGVVGLRRRGFTAPPIDVARRRGRGRTRFRVTLHGARIRWVVVAASSRADPRRNAERRIRVR
jgi:hypothetical protein